MWKIFRGNTIVRRFFKAFDCTRRKQMEQIFLAYNLHNETVTTIMVLCKITKAIDGDTDFFDIVTEIL